jgi:uncharacterized phage protein (TIGR01671 family)
MREIKFRAWHPKIGMSQTIEIRFAHGIRLTPSDIDNGRNYLSDDEWILMQFTGLKDKKGKDIYEGDIVEFENDVGNGPFRDKGVVEYEPEYAAFQLISGDLTNRKSSAVLWAFHDKLSSKPVILGNFYENSNLL